MISMLFHKKRFYIYKLIVMVLVILPMMNSSYAEPTHWQGEWGTWQKNSDGASFYGASISIRDCNADAACSFSFDFIYPKAKDETVTNLGCFFAGNLKITSPTSAIATAASSAYKGSCKFELSMDKRDNNILHVSKLSGTNCNYFCTVKTITPYPQDYHLRTHENYASIANFMTSKKQVCYADSSIARQVWCKNPEFTTLDSKIEDFNTDALIQKCAKESNIESCLKESYVQAIKSAQDKKLSDYKELVMPGDPLEASKKIAKIEGVYKYRFKNGTIDGGTYISENILEIVPVAKETIYFKEKTECFNGCGCLVYGLARYKKQGIFLFSDKGHNSDDIMQVFHILNAKRIDTKSYPLNSIFAWEQEDGFHIAFMENEKLVERRLDKKTDTDLINKLPKPGWSSKDLDLTKELKSRFSIPIKEKNSCLLKIVPGTKGIRLVQQGNCKEYCGVRGTLDNEFSYTSLRKIRYMTLLKNSQEYQSSLKQLDDR